MAPVSSCACATAAENVTRRSGRQLLRMSGINMRRSCDGRLGPQYSVNWQIAAFMKIGFVSLGCPKNLVDSEVMLGLAEQAGHEITADATGADVLVVNTCAFIDRAKQESIDTILEMADLKKQVPGRRLIVT